jgi:PAS domain S-box-containing protein
VYRELAERGSNFRNVETEITCRDGGKKTISWSNLADIVPIEGWYTWAVGVDVTEQKKAEQKLREREELHRITWQSIGDAVISTDINGNIIDMNSVAEKLTGYELSEARERPLHEVFTIVHNITGEPVENPIAEVISTGEVVALSNHTKLISAGGDVYHIADSAAPIRDDKGENRGVVLVFRDETESYLQRQRLRESEETFRRLFESMAQGVVYHDREGTIISANRAAQRILGLTCEQIMGRTSVDPRWKAIREDGSEFPGEMHPAMVAIETGKPVERKIMGIYRPESDRYVWISVSAVPEFRPGEKEPYRAFATFEDITERRRIRENIQNLLHEKEMLLKEVHHRVKNNMNIIASLLSLQSQMVENPDGAAALVDARDRIFSMQRLYERLYQSGSYTEIDLGEYLDDIIQEIVKTYENERITIFSRVDYFPVGVKTAVPVGIILNELVTNAIKHAFPDGRKGSIEISLIKKDNKGKAELSVIDDGIGLPEDFGFESSDSYGITVLKALVDQLEGTVEQVEAEGTGFLVTFFAGTSGGE